MAAGDYTKNTGQASQASRPWGRNNVAVLNYLRHRMGQDKAAVQAWYEHWILEGFEAVEALIKPGPYAFGSHVTVADINEENIEACRRRFGADPAIVGRRGCALNDLRMASAISRCASSSSCQAQLRSVLSSSSSSARTPSR